MPAGGELGDELLQPGVRGTRKPQLPAPGAGHDRRRQPLVRAEDYVPPGGRGLPAYQRLQLAHGAGLQVVAWTANTRGEWDALLAAGVDAIISDDPAALIAYLKEKKLR